MTRRFIFAAAAWAACLLAVPFLASATPGSSGPRVKPLANPIRLTPPIPSRPLKLTLPRPRFVSTPKQLTKIGVRPEIKKRKVLVPRGVDLANLARKQPVTSSDAEPIIGELDYITDGDKRSCDGCFVELGPGPQWVQIDLGKVCEVYAIVAWHYHGEARVYRDVIVQASLEEDFIKAHTLFNNDRDNSSGQGVGKDKQYIDDHRGEVLFPAGHTGGTYLATRPVRARYIRLYSNGNTSNDLNHYTEVEVYGTLEK